MEDKYIRDLYDEVKILKKQNIALEKRLVTIEKVSLRYRKSPFDIMYRIFRKVYYMVRSVATPSVTVIIPTHKDNQYIDDCILSVRNQAYKKSKIKILIVHNGNDMDYYKRLDSFYGTNNNVLLIHSEKRGAAAAREYARSFVTTQWMMFLDDDDYITPGYIKELVNCTLDKTIKIVCGKINDLYSSGALNTSTYINRSIKSAGTGKVDQYGVIKGCFATVCGKLYDSKLFSAFTSFDTELKHSEDVAFWIDNMPNIPELSVWSCANAKEAYVRRVRNDSISRPGNEVTFEFMCDDQLSFIDRYTEIIFRTGINMKHKKHILDVIDVNNNRMKTYYETLDENDKKVFRDKVFASESCFVNKSYYGKKKGIAFCHNFPPFVNASAYVASKRLSQISEFFEKDGISWHVVCADMRRRRDELWNEFYAKFQYTEMSVVGVGSLDKSTTQAEWADSAFYRVRDLNVDYVYSRSMWIGSHIAAYRYKMSHKDVTWIAEFSDPIAIGVDNKPKLSGKEYIGEMAVFNDYYRYVEDLVYSAADRIIFTNDNQKLYMLDYSGNSDNENVKAKSLIWNHPIISDRYANIVEHNLQFDETKLNIGFFGTFYENRDESQLLKFLNNRNVNVYVFTKKDKRMKEIEFQYPNLFIKPMVSMLEMYNIIKDLDYCFVSDISFPGDNNPYLPSKLADYLSAGGKVISLISGNSPMKNYKHENIIKTEIVDQAFIESLFLGK